MDISSRKKKILAAVIEEYIRTAEPVGSKAIAASADLGCSSATIRNELAELVSMGYLEQPHTSAGRVPTPLGYRMYVNELMEHKDLTAEETQAITRSLTGRHQRGELMTDASRLASQLTNYPAVTLTTSAGVTIRRFDLIYLDANSFIIVLLLSDDTVKNKLVHLPVSAEQSMIQKLAAVFNAHFTGIREPDITPTLISSVERAAQDNLGITAVIAAFAIEALTGAGALIDSVVDLAGTTVSAVANVTFAIVIMFYVLLDRRSLAKQSRRLLYANLSERKADQVCRIARLTHTTYARFLSGQCVEVVILGTMIFLAFSLCGIPYAGLTAALTAAFAFVPYIGALASCAIGVLLTLLAQPEKALLCLIVYQAVQFTENQFIYPHVVGSSVGLAPLWTLLAALLGGKLFGLVGIVFFIPLTAVVLQLVHEHTAQQLSEKKLDREDLIE